MLHGATRSTYIYPKNDPAMAPIALAGADHCRVCHGIGLQGLEWRNSMVIYGDFNGDLMVIYGDFNGDLMVIYGDLMAI